MMGRTTFREVASISRVGIQEALSANVSETVLTGQFSVEGDQGRSG